MEIWNDPVIEINICNLIDCDVLPDRMATDHNDHIVDVDHGGHYLLFTKEFFLVESLRVS